jgi:hypothetical protein
VKDDFFDSISCDASEREGGRTERTKFSEQRKIDTEVTGCELYNNNTGSLFSIVLLRLFCKTSNCNSCIYSLPFCWWSSKSKVFCHWVGWYML